MADRARREGLRDGPVRLADRRRRGRRADGAGDVPAGAAAHRVDRARAASPGCCSASTGCTSCCPGWRCSTSSWRSSCSAAWPAWSTTATGTAPGWRRLVRRAGRRRDGWGPVRGLLFRPWLLARRGLLRAGARHQVDGALPDGGVRPAGLGLERRRPAVVRGALGGAASRCSPTACRRSCSSSSWPASSTSPPGPAGWSTPTTTSRTSPRRSTPASSTRGRPATTSRSSTTTSGRPRSEPDASGPGELIQSLRSLWYYHQDVYTFHTHFLNCSNHTYRPSRRAGCCINRPVGVAADTDIKPGDPGLRRAAGSDCLRQVLLLGTPVIWWGGALALLFAGGDVGGRPRLAVRRHHASAPRRPGCPGCCTTTGRSSSSTRSRPCRSWCSRSRWPWAS